MKLKKIASLALAGVMAVSMLAGCSNNGNSNSNSGNDNGNVVPTSAVITLFNNGQSVANKAKVTFAADADFEAKLEQAVNKEGTAATTAALATDLSNMTGKTYVKTTTTALTSLKSDVGTVFWDASENAGNVADGKTQSWLIVTSVASTAALTPEAAVHSVVDAMDTNFFSQLADTTLSTSTAIESDYLNYTYTGTAAVVEGTAATGAPVYYIACVVTQTAAKETLKAPVSGN